MERTEAFALARRLRREGQPYDKIAAALAENGVVSKRTGKALSMGGVHCLLEQSKEARAAKPRRKKAQASRAPARRRRRGPDTAPRRTGDRSMLEIVNRLLTNERMAIDDRVAASTLLIESHLKSR